ncbi:peptidase inhibitor R3HDML [Brachyistius frenatus]|uniref:peptidase inhibitor R3HDML n=1 Tax=Brachyistius frenatus TaxID=100188 RepID=UPI0037E80B90
MTFFRAKRSKLRDEGLARSADSWASRRVWDHGPTRAMKYLGQNLSITTGSSTSEIVYLFSCQMVWASSSRVGCAVRTCSDMQAFGSSWNQATLLVCNYSIKGNWVGQAPYKSGKPCSACPSSYGATCWRNQCSPNTRRL